MRVDRLTVAALFEGPVPGQQEFWVCRDPTCDVVYYGDRGALLRSEDLLVRPHFKSGDGEALVCYCFCVKRSDIASAVREGHDEQLVSRIEEEVRSGNCACSVRNPTGRCCLGELRAAVKECRSSS